MSNTSDELGAGIVIIALLGTFALAGWFLYSKGHRAGFEEAMRLFYDRKARENIIYDQVPPEKVTINENRFEGWHEDIVEYPNADLIEITKPCSRVQYRAFSNPISGCVFKDGEGIW